MNFNTYSESSEIIDFSDLSSNNISYSKDNYSEIKNGYFPFFCIDDPIFEKWLFPNDKQERRFLLPEKSEEIKNNSLSSVKNEIEKKDRRKKGRRKKEKKNDNENENLKKIKCHNNNATDNILRKAQVHYLNFIESFLNDILENFGYKERFHKLDYQFKKNIKKNFVESLKEKTISEIISNKISSKYKRKKEDFNGNLCEKLKKENKVLENILSQNYLLLFQKVYYKNINNINLKDYGLNKDIFLSDKVKMYKDLLIKNKESFLNLKHINKCIKEYYYPKLVFALNYY